MIFYCLYRYTIFKIPHTIVLFLEEIIENMGKQWISDYFSNVHTVQSYQKQLTIEVPMLILFIAVNTVDELCVILSIVFLK